MEGEVLRVCHGGHACGLSGCILNTLQERSPVEHQLRCSIGNEDPRLAIGDYII